MLPVSGTCFCIFGYCLIIFDLRFLLSRMIELLRKLQYRGAETFVHYQLPTDLFNGFSEMGLPLLSLEQASKEDLQFVLAFVLSKAEIDSVFEKILPFLQPDSIVWFCFPKGSSKKYQVDINRDKGWEFLKSKDFLPVRIVSIDGDWSGLRFRHRQLISAITRKFT